MDLRITEFAKNVLAAKGFSWASAVHENGKNEMVAVYGFVVDDASGEAVLLVNKDQAERFIDCFATTNKVAFVATNAGTFQTIQIKGEYLYHRDPTEKELALMIDEFQPAKMHMIENFWGMAGEMLNAWTLTPALAVGVKCNEIFDQTPRKNTGNKIS